MTHFHKPRIPSILKWVSSNFADSDRFSVWRIRSLSFLEKNTRFYGRKRMIQTEICENLNEGSLKHNEKVGLIPRAMRVDAQAALLDYLHSTRNILFTDAENMSQNSPHFLAELIKKVNIGPKEDTRQSVTRFLRYYPINEFEPFYESLGLKPHEYGPLLPRDLTFLSDDSLLLENYHVLCNFGIERKKIGKICKEAREVFRYDHGVLAFKLQAYKELGLSKSFVARVLVCSPNLLVGDVNVDFIEVMQILRKGGIDMSWIEGHLSDEKHLSDQCSFNWCQLLTLLNLFSVACHSEEQLGSLICSNPGILFEDSGYRTLSLVGLLLKFGLTMTQMCSMFQEFPQMQVGKFILNVRRCLHTLNEIEMEVCEIGKIIRCHTLLVGSCTLKLPNTMLSELNIGRKRLCKFIQENPQEIKKLVVGSKVVPLPSSGEELRSRMLKTKFLKNVGFAEDSNEMEKAFKVFRGSGAEIQERFDCIVEAGIDRKEVCAMIRVAPQILNLSKDVIKLKIDFLVNDLGYPLSSLVTFPSYFNYTVRRIKLRLAMYSWLKDQGTADPMLALSTIISYADKVFVKRYVKRHPKGSEVWEDLKKKIYSE